LDASKHEGFVIVDKQFNRIKVKSPHYVLLGLLNWKDKDKLNARRMLDIVRINESSEFLSYFPQWEHLYTKIASYYAEFVGKLESIVSEAKKNGIWDADDKTFSIHCKEKLEPAFVSVLWNLRKNRDMTLRNALKQIDIKLMEQIIVKPHLSELNTLPDLSKKRERQLK